MEGKGGKPRVYLWVKQVVQATVIMLCMLPTAHSASINELFNEQLNRAVFDHMTTGFDLTGDHQHVLNIGGERSA